MRRLRPATASSQQPRVGVVRAAGRIGGAAAGGAGTNTPGCASSAAGASRLIPGGDVVSGIRIFILGLLLIWQMLQPVWRPEMGIGCTAPPRLTLLPMAFRLPRIKNTM